MELTHTNFCSLIYYKFRSPISNLFVAALRMDDESSKIDHCVRKHRCCGKIINARSFHVIYCEIEAALVYSLLIRHNLITVQKDDSVDWCKQMLKKS